MQMLSNEPVSYSPSDRVLLAEFVDGRSTDAFAELMRRHAGMVLGVCERRLGSGSESEDAAQAVFILMWQQARKLSQHCSIAGWLHTTTCNVCRNSQRARALRTKHEHEAAKIAKQSSESSESDWLAIREVLDKEIDNLPAKLRVPLILFHLEGRGLSEVADELNTTVSTVGTWLARAREALAGKLKRHGIAITAVALSELLSQHASAAQVHQNYFDTTIQLAINSVLDGVAGPSQNNAELVQYGTKTWYLSKPFMGAVAAFLVSIAAICLVMLWPVIDTWQSPDFPLLQGAWREVAEERDGGPHQVASPIEYTNWLIISGLSFKRVQELPNGQRIVSESGTMLLDDAGEQRAIDFRLWQGSVLGIYELGDDQLTLCVGEAVRIGQRRTATSRPDDFVTAKGDNRRLTKYERVGD
jgi:RNA polymerase sigma factor (sigma-70 family)